MAGVFGHIGVAMFVFEGNAVIMNVRAETKNKKQYPKILVLAIVSTLSLFMVFALICYLTFGEDTNSILTLSLPVNGFSIFVITCVCVNALCSYPV